MLKLIVCIILAAFVIIIVSVLHVVTSGMQVTEKDLLFMISIGVYALLFGRGLDKET